MKDNNKLTGFKKYLESKEDIPDFELIEAYNEHCIKELYREFVQTILGDLLKDDLEHYR